MDLRKLGGTILLVFPLLALLVSSFPMVSALGSRQDGLETGEAGVGRLFVAVLGLLALVGRFQNVQKLRWFILAVICFGYFLPAFVLPYFWPSLTLGAFFDWGLILSSPLARHRFLSFVFALMMFSGLVLLRARQSSGGA